MSCAKAAVLDLGGRVLALQLAGHLGGGVERRAEAVADLVEHAFVDRPRGDVPLGLADELLQLELDGDELLDLLVGELEGLDDDALGDLLGAGLDHDDGVGGAGDDQVHVGLVLELLERGVDDQLAVDAADVHRADGAAERDVADRERRGGAERREHVVGVSKSTDSVVATMWTSFMKPLGNSGRIGRSIWRAARIAFSLGRDSRLMKPPGILPAA